MSQARSSSVAGVSTCEYILRREEEDLQGCRDDGALRQRRRRVRHGSTSIRVPYRRRSIRKRRRRMMTMTTTMLMMIREPIRATSVTTTTRSHLLVRGRSPIRLHGRFSDWRLPSGRLGRDSIRTYHRPVSRGGVHRPRSTLRHHRRRPWLFHPRPDASLSGITRPAQ